MPDVVVGLDLSLTHTGWATVGDAERVDESGALKPKLMGVERLAWYEQQVKELVWFHKPRLAVIENYAYGIPSMKSQSHSIGELGGVVRVVLYKCGVPFIAVSPTTLKKFVTGRGNAEKSDVKLWCLKNWEMEFADNNQADAFGLAKFGECYLCPDSFRSWQRDMLADFKRKEGK